MSPTLATAYCAVSRSKDRFYIVGVNIIFINVYIICIFIYRYYITSIILFLLWYDLYTLTDTNSINLGG